MADLYPELIQSYIDNITPETLKGYRGGQYALDNYGIEKIKQGIPQGLNYGVYDIDDWIKQYNQGIGRNNPISIPQTQEDIERARLNAFNQFIKPVAQQDQEQPADNIPDTPNNEKFNNFRSRFINDFISGYQDNLNNAFQPENWNTDNNKNFLNRAGEIVGSLARFGKKPLVQSLLAGGIATALTGSPLYGAKLAAEYNQKMNTSNLYSDLLNKEGINTNFGIGAYVPDNTFKNITSLVKENKKDETTKANNAATQKENNRKNLETERLNRVKEIIKGFENGDYGANMTSLLLSGEGLNIPAEKLTESNATRKANSEVSLNKFKEDTEKSKQNFNNAGAYHRTEQGNTEKAKQKTETSKQAENYASANKNNAQAGEHKAKTQKVLSDNGGSGNKGGGKTNKTEIQPYDGYMVNGYLARWNKATSKEMQQKIAIDYKNRTSRDLFKDIPGLKYIED